MVEQSFKDFNNEQHAVESRAIRRTVLKAGDTWFRKTTFAYEHKVVTPEFAVTILLCHYFTSMFTVLLFVGMFFHVFTIPSVEVLRR